MAGAGALRMHHLSRHRARAPLAPHTNPPPLLAQASFNPWRSLPVDLLALPKLELFRLAAGDLPAWPRGNGKAAAAATGAAVAAVAAAAAGDAEGSGGAAEAGGTTGGGAGGRASIPGLPPVLAWCSLGGNPAAAPLPAVGSHVECVDLGDLKFDRAGKLGDGASGECFSGAQGDTPSSCGTGPNPG